MNHTYLTTTNYWAPLNDDTDEMNDEIEQINIIPEKQPIKNTKSNKWTRRIERRRLVIDSGATSNFVTEEMNLPRMGKSNKEVSYRTTPHCKLPITRNYQSTNSAKEQQIFKHVIITTYCPIKSP